MSTTTLAAWLLVTALALAIIGAQTGPLGGIAYGASSVFVVVACVVAALGLELRKPEDRS